MSHQSLPARRLARHSHVRFPHVRFPHSRHSPRRRPPPYHLSLSFFFLFFKFCLSVSRHF